MYALDGSITTNDITTIDEFKHKLIIRHLGTCDYGTVWSDMQAFTQQRDKHTPDEIWFLQHPSVYTLGLNGKPEHILKPSEIPIVNSDRGGQVTYHGPGQLICYVLIDIARFGIGVKKLVWVLEQSTIDLLKSFDIAGMRRQNAPGVYVNGAKIAALGLRVRRHSSYHGLSVNVNMDLSPFDNINPCGFTDLTVTQCSDLGLDQDILQIRRQLQKHIQKLLLSTITTNN